MKMTKLSAALAATVATAATHALDFSTVDTNPSGTAVQVGACAIVANATITNALREIQLDDAGAGDACEGSVDVACAPTLSSAEVRALVQVGGINNAGNIVGPGGDLASETTSIKKGALVMNIADGCANAVTQFAAAGDLIGGLSCGQGPSILATAGDDAAVLGAVTPVGNNHQMGIISATSLDGVVGFVKLDGVAPSLAATMSSNYNIVSNLSPNATFTPASTNGITVGIAAADGSNGVAYHNVSGSAVACAPLSPRGAITDASGGPI